MPTDELVFPLHRRAVLQQGRNEAGQPVLHIFHGATEISFDEPEFFGFAEALVRQPRFRAGDAMGWAPGQPWDRLRTMLLDLIEHGLLLHAEMAPKLATPGGAVASPLPPGPCPAARGWDECEAITAELTGRAVELGQLELVVPIFRIAHIALDTDGRQVGEANVFPPALRLDVPTEWRICPLPGTRYLSERPMNVTAMRVMRTHWAQMMALIGQVRAAYLRRCPDAEGAWTVGHVERLAVAVLALPTFQLMRRDAPVANGALHPALSSLFRVTDGVRMVMHQMLFVPVAEPTRAPDDAVTVDEILDYAERNYSFHSGHGVCAGPRAMVRELVQRLIEGPTAEDAACVFDPPVQEAVDAVEAALDYGMLALQAHAAIFSIWPVAARCYARLAEAVEVWPRIDGVQDALAGHVAALAGASYLGHERWRAGREDVYADMYRRCALVRRDAGAEPTLPALLTPGWMAVKALRTAATAHLQARFPITEALAAPVAGIIADALLRIQAALRSAAPLQARINALLRRAGASRPIAAADIDVHNRMQPATPNRLPFLTDELERLFGLVVTLDAERCAIADGASLPNSDGNSAVGTACPRHVTLET